MGAVCFQAISNLKCEESERRFFMAVEEFLPLLFSEYAMSMNLNSETELYSDIRKCIQDQTMPFTTLTEKLKDYSKVNSLISLFPISKDLEEWTSLWSKCTWEANDDGDIFVIDGHRFTMKANFLQLVKSNGEYFAYKYCCNAETKESSFIYFNTINPPVEEIVTDNPFIFLSSPSTYLEDNTWVNELDMTEEEFFELESIKSADEEQRQAITAGTERNIVVLAGAGSGKTRTLVSRLVYLHAVKKIPLNRIILLTFTKNAAENMKKRGEKILAPVYADYSCGKERPNVRAQTIDSFAYGIIRNYYQEVGFTVEPLLKLDTTPQTKRELFDLVDETISRNDMKGIFGNYYENGKRKDNFRYLVEDLGKFACGMSINYAGIERLLHEVISRQLADNTVYGFAFVSYLVKEAINDPTSNLKDIIAKQYDCVLMDEFQDINILQNEMFMPFYNTPMHFTFVGDDDQSIYGWRGSDTSIIKGLVDNPNVDKYYLLTNYRNNSNVVKAGNVILNHIADRAKAGQPIKPNKLTGAKIRISCYDDKYTNLSNEVERLIQSGYNAEEICVLSRDNNDKAKIIHSLNAAEIPVAREKIKIDVNDNYKLIKAIISVLNEYNIIAACREIKRITNDTEVTDNFVNCVVLGKKKPDKALEKVVLLTDELRDENCTCLADAVYRYSLKAGELFEKAINDRHSDPVFESFELFCSNNNAPWPISAKQLKEIFRIFEDNTRKENQSGGALDSGVKVSTIHSAKGLEYNVVLICGLSYGKYPNTEMIDKNYSTRCGQLKTLEQSAEHLKNLKESVPEDSFVEMLKDCASPNFSSAEKKQMDEFCEELLLISKRDVVGLTAKGVEYFMDAYKNYVAPLEKAYKDEWTKIRKKRLMYKERGEILNEEISIIENDEVVSKTKHFDLQTVLKKLDLFGKKSKKCKERFMRFEDSISAIKAHYKICYEASGYLSDMQKINEIEKIRAKLEEERQRSVNEEIRLFYVALTRAKDILYLCREAGAAESQFVSYIPDELKEDCAILTKEDEREFFRLKKELAKEVSKDKVNNDVVDYGTEKLINNTNFKSYIEKKIAEFRAANPVYRVLPKDADGYFVKAMGLLYIGEYTGSNFNTEFAHNMQRMAESLLCNASGTKAKMFKTKDFSLVNKIADDIHDATKACVTSTISKKFVRDLLTKESKFGDDLSSLKSAGVFHYAVRSGKYEIPQDVLNTWNKKTLPGEAYRFIAAVADIANFRNVLIHPSDKHFADDPIPLLIANMKTVIENC